MCESGSAHPPTYPQAYYIRSPIPISRSRDQRVPRKQTCTLTACMYSTERCTTSSQVNRAWIHLKNNPLSHPCRSILKVSHGKRETYTIICDHLPSNPRDSIARTSSSSIFHHIESHHKPRTSFTGNIEFREVGFSTLPTRASLVCSLPKTYLPSLSTNTRTHQATTSSSTDLNLKRSQKTPKAKSIKNAFIAFK